MTQPTVRNASPQAWRRLRDAITEREAKDMARDIAAIITADRAGGASGPPLATSIEYALVGYPWDRQRQV